MQPIAVVEHGYIIQHILLCFESGLIITPVDSLLLQAPEEALRYGVVPAVPFAAHTANEAVSFK